jgi:hypothetical protein
MDKDAVSGVMIGDEVLLADYVVLATPLKDTQEILQKQFVRMLSLPSSSAAAIQSELDQPVLESDRTNFHPPPCVVLSNNHELLFGMWPGDSLLSSILLKSFSLCHVSSFWKRSIVMQIQLAYRSGPCGPLPYRESPSRLLCHDAGY